MKYFGKFYPTVAYLDAQRVPAPVGDVCGWCTQPIVPGDDGWLIPSASPQKPVSFHRACWLRSVIGSVAHLERRCSCFVPGSTESDPPGMTVREAAEAALAAFEREE